MGEESGPLEGFVNFFVLPDQQLHRYQDPAQGGVKPHVHCAIDRGGMIEWSDTYCPPLYLLIDTFAFQSGDGE